MLTTGFPRFEGDFYGSFLLSLSRALVNAGAAVRVVCPHDRGVPLSDRFGAVDVRRFRYMLPDSLQRLAYGGGIPSNLRTSLLAQVEVPGFMYLMRRAARRWSKDCDLVHAQWTISGWAASFAGKPLLLTVRGSDLKLSKSRLARRLSNRALASADRVLTVSEDLRSAVLARGVSGGRVLFQPNGVDLKAFGRCGREEARERLSLPEEALIVLFAGQVAPVKNPLILAEMAAELGKYAPRPEVHLVGGGPSVPGLQAKAAALGVSDRVKVHGFRPQEEMPLWLAACDILALPSLSEGRPNVVLEAMAASRPVVATRVGGTPELVDDGQTGFLVEPANVKAFTAAVRRLLDEPASRDRMGAAGRRRVEQLGLCWDAVAAKHLEVYEEVLMKRTGV